MSNTLASSTMRFISCLTLSLFILPVFSIHALPLLPRQNELPPDQFLLQNQLPPEVQKAAQDAIASVPEKDRNLPISSTIQNGIAMLKEEGGVLALEFRITH